MSTLCTLLFLLGILATATSVEQTGRKVLHYRILEADPDCIGVVGDEVKNCGPLPAPKHHEPVFGPGAPPPAPKHHDLVFEPDCIGAVFGGDKVVRNCGPSPAPTHH